jgi:hypothetical protein
MRLRQSNSFLAGICRHWREAIFLFLLVWTLGSQAYKSGINPESALSALDYKVYYNAAHRLNTGAPLYMPPDANGVGAYIYPPPIAILNQPLAKLSTDQAFKVWTAFNILCLLGAIAFFTRAANFRAQDCFAVGLILLLSFRFWPTISNLALGQVNFITLALIAAIYYAQSRGKWAYTGILIALATLTKTWLIGLLFYLVLQRQWRALAWCLGSLAILLVASFSVVGWQEWAQFIHFTRENSSQPWLISQSLPGFARLHLGSNPLIPPLVDSPIVKNAFLLATYGLLGLATWKVFSASRFRQNSSEHQRNLQLGFYLLTLILALPLCHMEYYLLALPLFWTIVTWINRNSTFSLQPPAPGGILLTLLSYLLFTRGIATSGEALQAFQEVPKSLMVSYYFLAACILWTSTFYLLHRDSQTKQPDQRIPSEQAG